MRIKIHRDEYIDQKVFCFLPEPKLFTTSLARWTPDISSSLARSALMPRWVTKPWTLAWYVAVVMTSAPLRRNLLPKRNSRFSHQHQYIEKNDTKFD